jgi:hypothetical protein
MVALILKRELGILHKLILVIVRVLRHWVILVNLLVGELSQLILSEVAQILHQLLNAQEGGTLIYDVSEYVLVALILHASLATDNGLLLMG